MKTSPNLLQSLVTRHNFFNLGSEFNKCNTCQYKCCSSPISVDVSFADLLSLSEIWNKKPSQVFKDYCRIGINLDPDITNQHKLGKYHVKLSLELDASCPFNEDTKCSTYSYETPYGEIGRPVTCSIFPEILNIHKTFPIDAKTFSDYENTIEYFSENFPCVADNKVSKTRGQILLLLQNIINQEQALTQVMVFTESPAFLDTASIQKSMEEEFKIFFKEEKVLSMERINVTQKVTDGIRLFIEEEHPEIIKRLNRFLYLLDNNPLPFSDFLNKILDNPALLPSPCKEENLLFHGIPL
jgi:Fe-S-cluster containining protein